MANTNTNVGATGSYIVDIDSDADSTTQYFLVRKNLDATPADVFKVEEDGTVTVTGNIVRSSGQVLHNNSGANVNILLLKSGTGAGSDRLVFSYDGTDAKMVGGSSIGVKIVADNKLTFHFNADGSATADELVIQLGTTPDIVAKVDRAGKWFYFEPAANEDATLDPHDANADCELKLGIQTNTRGKVVLKADTLQANSERPGVLVFESIDGTTIGYFWFAQDTTDSNWYLWGKRSDPGANENSGTRIGAAITA